jgi:hypothetical protein
MNIYSNPLEVNQKLLHELFDYCDGELHWKVSPKPLVNIGDIAGHIEARGYKVIKIFGKKYKSHRLVFMYNHGYIPKFIDHIDNNRVNNRIENLRVATREQNNQNAKMRKDNTSGVKGVCWVKKTNRWLAQIQVNGISWRKTFSSLEDATKAVQEYRESKHKEFANHGLI